MKYFFISLFAACLLVVSVGGFRGDKFSKPPFEVFPDMDHQDKLKGQKASGFFADGMGARKPVVGTVPRNADEGLFSLEFGEGRDGYYYTGREGTEFGSGLPEELNLKSDRDFMRLVGRGEDMFNVHCAICHGESGNGNGKVGYHLAKVNVQPPSIHTYALPDYKDGNLYHVINKGKGNMGAYGHNLPVKDRWAIVAYVRALQESAKK